jgi:hypothetical protein
MKMDRTLENIMKKKIVMPLAAILMSAFICAPLSAHSMEKEETFNRSVKVSIDAPYALFGAFIGRAEFKVSHDMSLLFRLGYIDTRASINPNINPLPGPSASGKIGMGLRWYWHGGAMDGLYAEGNLDTDVTGTLSGMQQNLAAFNGRYGPFAWSLFSSFYAGYSWVTQCGFFADAAIGLELKAVVAGAPDFIQQIPVNMLQQQVRLNIGWAF